MNNSISFKRATEFAKFALQGKKDKGGAPLLDHAVRMAHVCESHELASIAILHDVLEDSDATLIVGSGRLSIRPGFVLDLTPVQASALEALTRKEGEVYADYITRVSANREGRQVKILDLLDHLKQTNTLPHSLRKRYTRALSILQAQEFFSELS